MSRIDAERSWKVRQKSTMESAAREDGDSNSLCEEKKVVKKKVDETEFDSVERKEKPCRKGEMEAKGEGYIGSSYPHEARQATE
jgi:hypothetical protein